MDTKLDLYFLATQGQWSDKHNFTVPPHGFYIYVEEEVITVRRQGGGGTYRKDDWVKKKKIKLSITYENKVYTKELIIDNINLSVKYSRVSLEEKEIELELYDVTLSDNQVMESIKLDISDISI
jgi:hypothetical protein